MNVWGRKSSKGDKPESRILHPTFCLPFFHVSLFNMNIRSLTATALTLALVAGAFTTASAQTKKKSTGKTSKSSSKSATTKAAPAAAPAPAPAATPAAAPASAPATTGKKGSASGGGVNVGATPEAAPIPASTTPTAAPQPVAAPVLTPDIASNGLRDALSQGIQKGVELVSKTDGYYKNPLIKIPFPAEFKMVEDGVRKIGMGSVADQAVESMNRAAEKAAGDALPIFLDAIKQLNFTDVMSILNGSSDRAATDFLQRTTTTQLTQKFKPIIGDALVKVDATKYWGTITQAYNQIPFVQKVNPDLSEYVTQKAVDGLFMMVAQEEKNIRVNPAARATDVLQQVFSGLGKK
jgi:Protein of unknown function (DUF4197)